MTEEEFNKIEQDIVKFAQESLVVEHTRADRMHNIAVIVRSLYNSGINIPISAERLRLMIISSHVPGRTIHDQRTEQYKGDMRAHGDALGGHGLKLESKFIIIGRKRKKIIPLNSNNFKKCAQYLASENKRVELEVII